MAHGPPLETSCEGPCERVVIDKDPPCPLLCSSKGCKSYAAPPDPDLSHRLIVWMFGGPSSGKTTHTNNLCSKLGLHRVHLGELLKKEIAKKTVRAPCLHNCMERGELVPNDVALELLRTEIITVCKKAPETKGFVIDGFPRDPRQGQLFEKLITPATIFIYLEADAKTLTARHVARARVTQIRWPTDKRNDNCPHGLLQVHQFFENMKSITEQYPHKLVKINIENKNPDQVFAEVIQATEKARIKLNAQTAARAASEKYYQSLAMDEHSQRKKKPPKPIVPL